MSNKKPVIALIYDFDGTLAPGDMPEHSFLPDLGIEAKSFWKEVKTHAQTHNMDEILSYMYLMIHKAKAQDLKISKKSFKDRGAKLKFFPGVETWFERINKYGAHHGITIHHYIISSGLREMIKGTKIKKNFKYIFASGFMYDANDVAKWPALAVNYTNKTQYLFRINKGIMNYWDNEKINSYIPNDRPVPFAHMIYFGDGSTDIPSMKMVKHQGGYAIAVYAPKKRGHKQKAIKLVEKENRADFAIPADYSAGKRMDKTVKTIIDKIASNCTLEKITKV